MQSTSAVPADLDSPDSQDRNNVHPASSRGNAKKLVVDIPPNVRPVVISTSSGSTTNAVKQKAYRERHKDRVQETDRLRKRKQRDA